MSDSDKKSIPVWQTVLYILFFIIVAAALFFLLDSFGIIGFLAAGGL